jgi:hypothetical protein
LPPKVWLHGSQSTQSVGAGSGSGVEGSRTIPSRSLKTRSDGSSRESLRVIGTIAAANRDRASITLR